MEVSQAFNWQALLITAATTTLVVSALKTMEWRVSVNWLVFLVSVVVTLLNTTFIEGAGFSDWQKIILTILMNMAFAVLFFNYAGKWFIDKLFVKVRNIFVKWFGKDEGTPEDTPKP